ncbi:hypothetical protein PAMP_001504 [Pampus punctatissimus]
MAQTNSGGQGTNGVADESPNMIVYRKTPSPCFVSVLQTEEKVQECQTASIQLLLFYWYSGHTELSSVSVARAKEECGK